MNKLKCFVILLLACALTPAMAQDPSEQAIQFPTGPACWTIEVRPHPSAPHPPAALPSAVPVGPLELKKMEVTQSDDLLRGVLTWSNGTTTETWWLKSPPWTLMDNPEPSGGVLLTSMPHLLPFPRPDAKMFSWVNDQTYDSKGAYNGKACMIYRTSMPLENRPPKFITGVEPPSLPHVAWIDEKTGLPVALDNGESLYIFTFHPPPQTPLTLPARFQDELTRAQNSVPNPKYLGKPRSWATP